MTDATDHRLTAGIHACRRLRLAITTGAALGSRDLAILSTIVGDPADLLLRRTRSGYMVGADASTGALAALDEVLDDLTGARAAHRRSLDPRRS